MKRLRELTILEQVQEAPVGSVVVVHYKSGGTYASNEYYSDALVKTGTDGYKAAYYGHTGYLKNATIHTWLNAYPEGEFYLINPNKGEEK